ncbi:hypothetical protein M422DRAFT_248428 [Sphaerobolus stellatus SS14]|uniref:Uncharacterized protein n=1 Tax=Sphaerobolus stellatus (strain SS14) TaxID=990650 RepID=A0A0C9UVZ8_SPHS4|nr:hypothetical protein M422DRAFT_248428 [Sphaerobolus stellatus SS14]
MTVPCNEHGHNIILDRERMPIVYRINPSQELLNAATKFQEVIECLCAKFRPSTQYSHKRGNFDMATFGILYGNGKEMLKWRLNNPCNEAAIAEFRSDPAVLQYIRKVVMGG